MKIVVGLVPQIRLLSLGTRNSNVLKVITVIIIDLIKFSNVGVEFFDFVKKILVKKKFKIG